MSMQTFVKNVDNNFHKAAQQWRSPEGEMVGTLHYFAWEAEKEGIGPTDAELKESEDYWFGELGIERSDYKKAQRIKELAADSWALDRVMEEMECPVKGPYAPVVQKAFTTSTTQVLFPFFYDNNIVAGMIKSSILDRLLMDIQNVNSQIAIHAEMSNIATERATSLSSEGALPNTVVITAVSRQVALQKFMSRALISYEAARLQRIPVFAMGLRRIGEEFQNLLTNYVLNVLIAGDGANGAATTSAAAVSGSPTYADIVTALLAFPQSYTPDLFIANRTTLAKILNMAEFKDPMAGFSFQKNGIFPTPLGLDLARWDVDSLVSGWLSTVALMIDSDKAAMGYQWMGMMTETDKIISTQWEEVVTSTYFGAAIWDPSARLLLTAW